MGTSGSASGRWVRTSRPASRPSTWSSAAPTTSSTGCHSLSHRDRARLQTRHIEKVGDEPIEAPGLLVDRLDKLPTARRGQRFAAAQQRARGPCDRRQGRAQVVRHGSQQRASDPFRFRLQLGRLRLGGQVRPLDRECDLARERFQEVQALGVERPPARADTDHADGAAGDQEGEEERDTAGECCGAETGPLGVVEGTTAQPRAPSGRGRTPRSRRTRPSTSRPGAGGRSRPASRRPPRGGGPRRARPRRSPPRWRRRG